MGGQAGKRNHWIVERLQGVIEQQDHSLLQNDLAANDLAAANVTIQTLPLQNAVNTFWIGKLLKCFGGK